MENPFTVFAERLGAAFHRLVAAPESQLVPVAHDAVKTDLHATSMEQVVRSRRRV